MERKVQEYANSEVLGGSLWKFFACTWPVRAKNPMLRKGTSRSRTTNRKQDRNRIDLKDALHSTADSIPERLPSGGKSASNLREPTIPGAQKLKAKAMELGRHREDPVVVEEVVPEVVADRERLVFGHLGTCSPGSDDSTISGTSSRSRIMSISSKSSEPEVDNVRHYGEDAPCFSDKPCRRRQAPAPIAVIFKV